MEGDVPQLVVRGKVAGPSTKSHFSVMTNRFEVGHIHFVRAIYSKARTNNDQNVDDDDERIGQRDGENEG
jgi:hypothetical protein